MADNLSDAVRRAPAQIECRRRGVFGAVLDCHTKQRQSAAGVVLG